MKDNVYAFLEAIKGSPLYNPSLSCNNMSGYCLCQTIQHLKEDIKHQVSDLMLSEPKNKFATQQLRTLLLTLTDISNKIYARADQKSTPLFNTFQAIEDLFQHIYLATGQALNDTPLPHFMIDTAGINLQEEFGKQLRKLKKDNVQSQVLDSLSHYFKQIDSRLTPEMTYQELIYAQKIFRGLEHLLANTVATIRAQKIWKTLIHLNFNREPLMSLSNSNIQQIVQADLPLPVIKLQLEEILKELQQIDDNPNYAYNSSRTSLKAYIEKIVIGEIKWLDKKQRSLSTISTNMPHITVSLTAKQLVLLTKLHVELGIITDSTVTKALSTLLGTIQTTKGGALSYETNRKKINEIDQNTVAQTKEYLQSLLSELNKMDI